MNLEPDPQLEASPSPHFQTLPEDESLPRENAGACENLQENDDDEIASMPIMQQKHANRAHKTRLFGLPTKKPPVYTPVDDYEHRYPPDEFGQEMGPGARVWRVYLDEAELFDRDMVEGWKDGIDVLLVFAGLFSAVVTTFVVQTSQKLDRDYNQVSASLLTELIAIQRAIATSSTLDHIQPSQLTFSSFPQYSKADAWVNGLWFTSLTLSLVTALSSVLTKQWIQHYTSFVSGSALERARIYQFRYSGLERWGVRAIIGVLPLLLYMALFLFLLGLAIFLQALKPEIAYVVAAIGGVTFTLYVVTNGLPVFYPQCPYRTPLIEHIHTGISLGIFGLQKSKFVFARLFLTILGTIISYPRGYPILNAYERWTENLLWRVPPRYKHTALKTLEAKAAESEQDRMVQGIIEWLLVVSSNPSVKPIALQSISGLRVGFSRITEMLGQGCLARRELIHEFKRQQSLTRNFGGDPAILVDSPQFYNTERILRASVFVPTYGPIFPWHLWRLEPRDTDLLSRFPRPLVWESLNWNRFDKDSPDMDQNLLFSQVSTTYRVLSIQHGTSNSPTTAMRKLSSLATPLSINQCPAAWNAWFYILARYTHDGQEALSITTIYSCLRPFFTVLLSPESGPDGWVDLLSTLCSLLPPSLVEQSFGSSLNQLHPSRKSLPAVRLCSIHLLLSCITEEWDKSADLSQGAALEEITRDTCGVLYEAIETYGRNHVTMLPKLAVALDKIVGHKGFAQSRWERATYESVFKTYFKAFMNKYAQPPTSDFSDVHFYEVLESAGCVRYCLEDLFGQTRSSGGPDSSKLASHIAVALGSRSISDLGIKNTFDAFMGLSSVTRYLTQDVFTPYSKMSWSFHMQPLVRWMLDYVINHGEIVHSHPSIRTLATSLIDHPYFLSFICSSFFIEPRGLSGLRVVFSEESSVLLRLAEYHKGKPHAIEVWRNFLYLISKWCRVLCRNDRLHGSWTRVDFNKYRDMVDTIDQLASTIGLDNPPLKAPRFKEDYIIKLLRRKGRPLHASPPDTNTAAPSSLNHQNMTQAIQNNTSNDINSPASHHGASLMV